MQPVHVGDAIDNICACLGSPETIGQTLDLLGPEPMPFHSIVDTVESAGRFFRRPRLHINPAAARFLARFLSVAPGHLLTRDQVALFTDLRLPEATMAPPVAPRIRLTADTVREYLWPAGSRKRNPRAKQIDLPDEDGVGFLIGNATHSRLSLVRSCPPVEPEEGSGSPPGDGLGDVVAS